MWHDRGVVIVPPHDSATGVQLAAAPLTYHYKLLQVLVLITNRKSHMSFRLVSNSVTLNDLERRNSPNDCVIASNSAAFWPDYIKVVEDTTILSATVM